MKKIVLIITIVLFLIPFFWLKPGELDLGGDSSRLYYYDPYHYLINQSIYGIIPSGLSSVTVNSYIIPYLIFLIILGKIVYSKTLVLAIINGITLSVGFISIYFITKNFNKSIHKDIIREISCILAGLFYVFCPIMTMQGWEKALTSHLQIFLNPLIFLLFLLFLNSKKILYLLILLLVTFIFSFGFSFPSAPAIFAFYPLTFVFILIYKIVIEKQSLPWLKIAFGLCIFLLLQSFHIVPEISNILHPNNQANISIFSISTTDVRGLSYFSSLAANVRVTLNLIGLPQGFRIDWYDSFLIIFPLIIIMGSIYNKKKSFILFMVFFILTLFLMSANITQSGFFIYQSLFNIPGFAMFRNFFGQWSFVYLFFYSILLSICLSILFEKLNKRWSIFIGIYIIVILFLFNIRFINGSVINIPLSDTKNVKIPVIIDKPYKDFMSYFEKNAIDGKVLTLPLTDFGYQILAGTNKGAYEGPSMIGYLLGIKDFPGYQSLEHFGDTLLSDMQKKNYSHIQKLLGLLNIRYIFHNDDTNIYDKTFFGYPYQNVRGYMPSTQKKYQQMLIDLGVTKIRKFGKNYNLYELNNDYYLPHIYVSNDSVFTDSNNTLLSFLLNDYTVGTTYFSLSDYQNNRGKYVLSASDIDPINQLRDNYHLHISDPFISQSLYNWEYFLVEYKEEFNLWRLRKNKDDYLAYSLLYLKKRIKEIEDSQNTIQVLHDPSPKSGETDSRFLTSYNTWESQINRYQKQFSVLMMWLQKQQLDSSIRQKTKIIITEELFRDRGTLAQLIETSNLPMRTKNYLLTLENHLFDKIIPQVDVGYILTDVTHYSVNIPTGMEGEYAISLKRDEIESDVNIKLQINGTIYKPINWDSADSIINFGIVNFNHAGLNTLEFSSDNENLYTNSMLKNPTDVITNNNQNVIDISNDSPITETGHNMLAEIHGWMPEKQYSISFQYKTMGDDYYFNVYDKRSNGESPATTYQYLHDGLHSLDWKTRQAIITTDPNSEEGYIGFSPVDINNKSDLLIRDISVKEIVNPNIYFEKVQQSPHLSVPKIIFQKINPTRYRIEVSNATQPYYLMFLDNFNSNWKLVLDLSSHKTMNPIVGSYLSSNVLEVKPENSFFDDIGTLFYGPYLADNTHTVANGYANAWYIKPSDVNNKSSYTIILNLDSEKTSYVTMLIALSTCISLVIWLIFYMFKKTHETNT